MATRYMLVDWSRIVEIRAVDDYADVPEAWAVIETDNDSVRPSDDWQPTATGRSRWLYDPMAKAAVEHEQGFDDWKAQVKRDLGDKIVAVRNQGVDGPQGLGEAAQGPRSWPTDDAGWQRVLETQLGIEREAALPGTGLIAPYMLVTLKPFDPIMGDKPDVAALGNAGTNNTFEDLLLAMFVHRQAVANNAKALFQDWKAATTPAELAAIDINTGWPDPPSNP